MTCEDSAAERQNHESQRLVRVSVARVGTADFDAGGWEGRGPARPCKNCGHNSLLGRAGQLFTPLGRYAARDHAGTTLSPLCLKFGTLGNSPASIEYRTHRESKVATTPPHQTWGVFAACLPFAQKMVRAQLPDSMGHLALSLAAPPPDPLRHFYVSSSRVLPIRTAHGVLSSTLWHMPL